MGSLHNIVSVCSGRAGAVPGKKRVPGTGSDGFRGLDRLQGAIGWVALGSVPEVWTELVLGTGFREPKVLRRFLLHTFVVSKVYCILLYFERILLYFESILLYFESILLYFESILLYFESILWYFESMNILSFANVLLHSGCTLLYFESILCNLKVYFCTLKGHFCTLKVYFCTSKYTFVP